MLHCYTVYVADLAQTYQQCHYHAKHSESYHDITILLFYLVAPYLYRLFLYCCSRQRKKHFANGLLNLRFITMLSVSLDGKKS